MGEPASIQQNVRKPKSENVRQENFMSMAAYEADSSKKAKIANYGDAWIKVGGEREKEREKHYISSSHLGRSLAAPVHLGTAFREMQGR